LNILSFYPTKKRMRNTMLPYHRRKFQNLKPYNQILYVLYLYWLRITEKTRPDITVTIHLCISLRPLLIVHYITESDHKTSSDDNIWQLIIISTTAICFFVIPFLPTPVMQSYGPPLILMGLYSLLLFVILHFNPRIRRWYRTPNIDNQTE
jgi:hypothetical protein